MRALLTAALVCAASAAVSADPVPRTKLRACPGRGYVPYAYPAFGSCPCGEDGCFRPGRYYSCDDCYETSFWRRWRRAHFRGGSMLGGVPSWCVCPPERIVTVPAQAGGAKELVPATGEKPATDVPAPDDPNLPKPGVRNLDAPAE